MGECHMTCEHITSPFSPSPGPPPTTLPLPLPPSLVRCSVLQTTTDHPRLAGQFSCSFSSFSHITEAGAAHMVDISSKPVTSRYAIASGKIHLTKEAIQMVADDERSQKGSVLRVAEVAAVMAAKRTPDIIPLCHSLSLSHVGVAWDIQPDEGYVVAMVTVSTEGKTGVEMEALLGVTVALVTVFDMTKSVSHEYTISDVRLEAKAGGKTGYSRYHGNK